MDKQILIDIYNMLTQVETRGQSTLTMAECIHRLASVINAIDENGENTEKTNE